MLRNRNRWPGAIFWMLHRSGYPTVLRVDPIHHFLRAYSKHVITLCFPWSHRLLDLPASVKCAELKTSGGKRPSPASRQWYRPWQVVLEAEMDFWWSEKHLKHLRKSNQETREKNWCKLSTKIIMQLQPRSLIDGHHHTTGLIQM